MVNFNDKERQKFWFIDLWSCENITNILGYTKIYSKFLKCYQTQSPNITELQYVHQKLLLMFSLRTWDCNKYGHHTEKNLIQHKCKFKVITTKVLLNNYFQFYNVISTETGTSRITYCKFNIYITCSLMSVNDI